MKEHSLKMIRIQKLPKIL